MLLSIFPSLFTFQLFISEERLWRPRSPLWRKSLFQTQKGLDYRISMMNLALDKPPFLLFLQLVLSSFDCFSEGWGYLALGGGSTSSLFLPCFPSRALLLNPSAIFARGYPLRMIKGHRLHLLRSIGPSKYFWFIQLWYSSPSLFQHEGISGNKVDSFTINSLKTFPRRQCPSPWLWGIYRSFLISIWAS